MFPEQKSTDRMSGCGRACLEPNFVAKLAMKMRIIIAATLFAFVLTSQGCTNTQPSYYGTYPAAHAFGPNHGYEPYASAPYDPYGAYYHEPPESHRDCDERPCIAYRRNAEVDSLQPKIIALPSEKQPFNQPSTI